MADTLRAFNSGEATDSSIRLSAQTQTTLKGW
jgi:hypothetical protein